jgi:hypothetical protein
VRDRLSSESLQDEIASAIWQADHIAERSGGSDVSNALIKAVRALLVALSASIGECRLSNPYSPLHPVIEADGSFRWCCNHSPQHCS